MSEPPPLPPAPPRRGLRLVFAVILAIICLGVAGYTITTQLLPVWMPPEPPHAAIVSDPRPPLRPLDAAKLAAQYPFPERQPVYQRLRTATLTEFDRLHPATAAGYREGRQAAELYALIAVWNDFLGEGLLDAAENYAYAAYMKGLRDPLLQSLCDHWTYDIRVSFYNHNARGHINRSRALLESSYPVLYKFTALGILLKNITYSERNPEDCREDMAPTRAEIPGTITSAGKTFADLLRENYPTELLFARTADFFDCIDNSSALVSIADAFDAALAAERPDHPARAAIRGEFLVNWAWQARGSGWANTVTEQGWRDMAARLAQAEKILTAAWEKNPDDFLAATIMLRVVLGQNSDRPTMETWFERATADHPDNFRAYHAKQWYLQPRWHGTARDVADFGAACVQTGNWRAKLPLILPIGLRSVAQQQKSLYESEAVWKMVQPVYEEFLRRYPESVDQRTAYANWALRSNHREILRAQLDALGPYWARDQWSAEEHARAVALAKSP